MTKGESGSGSTTGNKKDGASEPGKRELKKLPNEPGSHPTG